MCKHYGEKNEEKKIYCQQNISDVIHLVRFFFPLSS
uniref:Uncharacterized protein n=1 Tax=Anguilla anguilla TaxID=7936 RepID=A0A0E9W1P4_ANGAN